MYLGQHNKGENQYRAPQNKGQATATTRQINSNGSELSEREQIILDGFLKEGIIKIDQYRDVCSKQNFRILYRQLKNEFTLRKEKLETVIAKILYEQKNIQTGQAIVYLSNDMKSIVADIVKNQSDSKLIGESFIEHPDTSNQDIIKMLQFLHSVNKIRLLELAELHFRIYLEKEKSNFSQEVFNEKLEQFTKFKRKTIETHKLFTNSPNVKNVPQIGEIAMSQYPLNLRGFIKSAITEKTTLNKEERLRQ